MSSDRKSDDDREDVDEVTVERRGDEGIQGIYFDNDPIGAIIHDLRERVDELEEELAKERAKREELEHEASKAVKASDAVDSGVRADGSGPTKKQRAMWLSRDTVIRRTAKSINTGPRNAHGNRSVQIGSVTNKEVQNMAEGDDVDLKWATVDSAWNTLVKRHDVFVVNTDGDEKRLTLNDVDDVSPGLVGIVEDSLGRTDLTNRFVGGGD
jgi:hypothetical protein